jgi:hypothetical protein
MAYAVGVGEGYRFLRRPGFAWTVDAPAIRASSRWAMPNGERADVARSLVVLSKSITMEPAQHVAL